MVRTVILNGVRCKWKRETIDRRSYSPQHLRGWSLLAPDGSLRAMIGHADYSTRSSGNNKFWEIWVRMPRELVRGRDTFKLKATVPSKDGEEGTTKAQDLAVRAYEKTYQKLQDQNKTGKEKISMTTLRERLVRLAHTNPDLRPHILPLLKDEQMKRLKGSAHQAAVSKVANKPILTREGLNKAAVLNGDGAMLYFIDPDRNSSKFYEMLIRPERDSTYTLLRRWGALTDSGTTGRVDSKDQRGLDYGQAQKELQKIYKSKTRKGYVDTFSPAHKSPIDGKKLKQGEYPLGLVRQVGFGWGTQSMGQCIPALRDMVEHLDGAIKEIQERGKSDHIKEDLDDAMGTISTIAKEDSTMAGKLKKYISHVVRRVSGSPRFLPDPEGQKLIKEVRTIINYVKKQTAYCR
jgi:predicted DNA-binding WGR domain protein